MDDQIIKKVRSLFSSWITLYFEDDDESRLARNYGFFVG